MPFYNPPAGSEQPIRSLEIFARDLEGTSLALPLRIAEGRDQEDIMRPNGERLLLLPYSDYQTYQEVFDRAKIPRLDLAETSKDNTAAALIVPSSAKTVRQVYHSSYADDGKALAGVLHDTGRLIHTMGEATGLHPDPLDLFFGKILNIRKINTTTILPPIDYVSVDKPESLRKSQEQLHSAIMHRLEQNPISSNRRGPLSELYSDSFMNGLRPERAE